MTVHAIAPLAKTRRQGFSCTAAEFDRMCAWADACGFQDELLHVVVEKWAKARQHG